MNIKGLNNCFQSTTFIQIHFDRLLASNREQDLPLFGNLKLVSQFSSPCLPAFSLQLHQVHHREAHQYGVSYGSQGFKIIEITRIFSSKKHTLTICFMTFRLLVRPNCYLWMS